MICVSLGRSRHKMMMLEHQSMAERGAKLVELRLDYLQTPPDLTRLLDKRPTPVVVTCRRASEQGKWTGTEEQRLTLLRAAILAGVDYIDLEEDIAAKIPRYGKTKRIISYHNFDETPADLLSIHQRLSRLNPDIIKIATMARSVEDSVRVLKMIEHSKIPTAAFCMGEYGSFTRVLCGRYGSPLTYCTISRERVFAPGQLTFQEMTELYRYDAITSETRLYGVVGDPIAQSFSPLLHNTAFAENKLNAVYLPLRVSRGAFDSGLNALQELRFSGFSVTIPHKEAALARVPSDDADLQAIGAVNTLYHPDFEGWYCDNTDIGGAIGAFKEALRPDESLTDKRVMILGAGGAARALAYGLRREGCGLIITARSLSKAKELAEQVGCRFVSWENRGVDVVDAVVNCTPIGMHPNVDETPYHANWMRDEYLIFDTVYNPEQTLFIKEAKQRGCRTVSGISMFVRQAAAQFRLFTGVDPSYDTFSATLRRAISAAR